VRLGRLAGGGGDHGGEAEEQDQLQGVNDSAEAERVHRQGMVGRSVDTALRIHSVIWIPLNEGYALTQAPRVRQGGRQPMRTVLVLAVVSVACGSPDAEAQGLLVNPGFEQQSGAFPDGWTSTAGPGSTAVSAVADGTAHAGQRYIRIAAGMGQTVGIASDRFSVVAVQRYRLSLWVRRKPGALGLTLWSIKMDWYDSAGVPVGTTTLLAQPGDPTYWFQYSFDYAAPQGASTGRVRIEVDGASDLGDVDDVQVVAL
jgi:hypothetical protein